MASGNKFKEKEKPTPAPKKKKTKKKSTKKTPLKPSFKIEDRHRRLFGLFLILVAVFMLVSFTSFFFTWDHDNGLVKNNDIFGLLSNPEIRVDNWLGKFGALISHQFMDRWFGIASFTFILISFLYGFRILFDVALLPIKKSIRYSLVTLLVLPPLMSFLFSSSKWLFLGGSLGYLMNNWLTSTMGTIGAAMVFVFTLLALIVYAVKIELVLPNVNLGFLNIDLLQYFKKPALEGESESANDEEVFEDKLPDYLQKDKKAKEEKKEKSSISLDIFKPKPPKQIEPEIDLEPQPTLPDLPEKDLTIALTDKVEMLTPVNTGIPEVQPEETSEIIGGENGELSIELIKKEDETLNTVVEQSGPVGDYDPKLDLSSYEIPPVDLLDTYADQNQQMTEEELKMELEMNKNKIVETLGHYNIAVEKIKATIGPTVTLFEIVPQAGIRISKIKNLEDDIALSLAALGIRIIAPIPGKGTIGIEVPNRKPEIVSMYSMINSEKYQSTKYELPLALGKTISNEVFVADLTKMPHILMAGSTGQGKSVGLNAILISLLYKKHPSQIKFVLVDPKKVELTLFKKIERHYLAKLPDEEDAIVTDNKAVVATLNSLCKEMDERYELLKNGQVRNLKEYNAKFIKRKLNPNNGHRFLPYIVVVIDEFADLIMTAGREAETPLTRLAQLARAIGIHIILATQRPSVNIITGTIKANFPGRIAFRVTSKVDSRTILDTGGAEQLVGRGDMLFSTGADLTRLQCAFVDTPEVDKITEFIGSQRGYPEAFLLPEYVVESEQAGGAGGYDPSERDALFDEAARIVVQHQQGSASLLQRRLKLGYNRAGRIVDQLEDAGIIGEHKGSKARAVLITDLESLEQLLQAPIQ
ncbi:MAG: DNA translocase FtsK [Bacteroidia bacterium]|nr:DNA translocase FtsK [Bacteroidia bacterium]